MAIFTFTDRSYVDSLLYVAGADFNVMAFLFKDDAAAERFKLRLRISTRESNGETKKLTGNVDHHVTLDEGRAWRDMLQSTVARATAHLTTSELERIEGGALKLRTTLMAKPWASMLAGHVSTVVRES